MADKYSTSLYIGESAGGQPVFFDTHTQIYNNKPPGTLITGSPGAGKTFFAMTLAAQSALLGKTTVILDPKGDFLSLSNLSRQEIGDLNFVNLGEAQKRTAGILDPFNMSSDAGEALTLVVSVIDLFVGGMSDTERTALTPVLKDVQREPNPSLLKLVYNLRGSEKEAARDLGTKLDLIAQNRIASVCFSPGRRRRKLNITRGTNIITFVGLPMPGSMEEARSTSEGRLSSGILFLVTNFIKRVMNDESSLSPKTLIIDEAWSVISSKQGADTIKSVSLLGRSKNLSMVLITQSTSHLEHLDIDNTIASRFAFRTDNKEAARIVESMELPQNEGFENILTNLDNGQCLVNDWKGRYSAVQISQWRSDWAKAFDSNPSTKNRQ